MLTERATGLPVEIGALLAEGGEGRIHRTDRPGVVAKLYHHIVAAPAAKLAALLAMQPVAGIAWPFALLTDRGRIVGYLMNEVADAQPLTALASPRLRRQQAPGFTWFYLHAAARDLARIVGAAQAAGLVVGDLKPENALIDARGRVTLVDADSMQLAGHPCAVGAEGFLAPELVGAELATVERTAEHDGFALGVLVHLLLLGHHPFAGVWRGPGDPPGLDALVKAGHLPGLAVSPQRPGPFAVSPNALHPALRGLLRRCFVDGHRRPAMRPTAAEWAAALTLALDDLVLCDRAPTHFRAAAAGPCPWCARGSFPPPPDPDAPRALVAALLHRAIHADDLPRQAFLWAHHRFATGFEAQRPALDALAEALPVAQRLRHLTERAPDDAEAIALAWRKLSPAGVALGNALVPDLTELAAQAEARLAALGALRRAFAEGIATPGQATALRAAFAEAEAVFGPGSRFLRPYARRSAEADALLQDASAGDFG